MAFASTPSVYLPHHTRPKRSSKGRSMRDRVIDRALHRAIDFHDGRRCSRENRVAQWVTTRGIIELHAHTHWRFEFRRAECCSARIGSTETDDRAAHTTGAVHAWTWKRSPRTSTEVRRQRSDS